MNDNFNFTAVTTDDGSLSWEECVLWLKAQPDQDDLIKACFYEDPLQSAAERYYLSTEWLAVRKELPQVGRDTTARANIKHSANLWQFFSHC